MVINSEILRLKNFNLFSDFGLLIKMRLSVAVILTSLGSFVYCADVTDTDKFILLAVGGFFITSAANILNEVFEYEYDGLMERTKNRPLVLGKISVQTSLIIAGCLSIFGIIVLNQINSLTSLLGIGSLIIYSFVYTPLKRVGESAVIVGAISGALPMLIGQVAANGKVSFIGMFLFLILFFWQFPHFWAIAMMRIEEYKAANFKFLPFELNGNLSVKVKYSSLMFGAALVGLPFVLLTKGQFENQALFIVLEFLSLIYLLFIILFSVEFNRISAKKLLIFSIIYLLGLLVSFLLIKSII